MYGSNLDAVKYPNGAGMTGTKEGLALGGLKQKTGGKAPGFFMVLGILNFKTDGNLPYARERSLWFLACPQRNDPWPQDNGGGSNNRAEGLMVKEPRLVG